MKKKVKYTYPKLAEYLRELFAPGAYFGWGGLEHHMETALNRTVAEMMDRGEIIMKDNLIQLPHSPVKNKIRHNARKRHEGG